MIFGSWASVCQWGRRFNLRCVCQLRVFGRVFACGFFGACVRSGWRRLLACGGYGRVSALFRGVCSPWFRCFLVVFVFVGFWVVFILFFEFSFCLLNFLLV